MSIASYIDHQVPRAISAGLRSRGVDVLTAYEDNTHEMDNPTLLDKAGELGRVLFTRDDDLLIEFTSLRFDMSKCSLDRAQRNPGASFDQRHNIQIFIMF